MPSTDSQLYRLALILLDEVSLPSIGLLRSFLTPSKLMQDLDSPLSLPMLV